MVEFKIKDFFYPLDLIQTYWLLRRSEHWSPEQFQHYQGDRLARLLQFCATEVSWYEKTFPKLGLSVSMITPDNALDCLRKLPILDKDALRSQPAEFQSRSFTRFHPKAITTSGTTGTPLTVYWDRGSNVFEFCSIQRLWRWAGIRIGNAFLDLRSRVFTGTDRGLVRRGSMVYTRNWKANGLEFSSDHIDESNLAEYYSVLRHYQPRLVRGHPQAIQHLASLVRKSGLEGWQPTAVTTASETLYDFQRQEIAETWRVPILDSYGLKEHNVFIAQCREGGYHINPEYGICEIVDDDGNSVAPGEEGWIIATGLHNYAQPLLRYHTRDRAVAADNRRCPCGRTLPLVDRIVGRIDDCLYTRDGKRYSGMHFVLFGRRGIKKARLIQDDMDSVKVELVVTVEFDDNERTALEDALQSKLENKLKFELEFKDDINQETPGKFKFVVSKVNPANRRLTA